MALPAAGVADQPAREEIEHFEKRVRPILAEVCQKCHGADRQEGGLRLDSRSGLLAGAESGKIVDEGRPERSRLLEVVSYSGDVKMPPKGKLSDEQIADLALWARRGFPWAESRGGQNAAAAAFDLEARRRQQWALQPVRRPAVPPVRAAGWPLSPIDNFILGRLEEAGLSPAPPADRAVLLRRVTFDLVGLPPTLEELDRFLADKSPDAFARVVDRLLASPHHGVRWGRHWLDLVRFAETSGHEFDFEIPRAFEYRDYVIRALNADVPYDQFVVEHLAGDLLERPRRHPLEGFNESIIGTGFWFLGESKHSPVDIRVDARERLDNQLDVFSKAFLATTLGCARCHDHKFDALTTRDYYALCGYLQSSRYQIACVDDPAPRRQVIGRLDALDSQLATLARDAAGRLAAGKLARLDRYLLSASGPANASEAPAAGPPAATEAQRMAAWRDWLRGAARNDAENPFFLWARWVAHDGPADAASFGAWLEPALAEASPKATPRDGASPEVLVDFARHGNEGWFTDGEAFGQGPVTIFEAMASRAAGVPNVAPGVAHSGRHSVNLRGALRSPTFTITRPYLHYRVAGRGARLRLVIDSFQQIRNPIYGGLEVKVESADRWQWVAQNVEKWVGHLAYFELLDEGEGFAALSRVLLADGPSAPAARNAVAAWIAENPPKSAEMLAAAYRDLFARAARQLAQAASGGPGEGPAAPAESAALGAARDWLLTAALPGSLADALAASEETRFRLAALREQRAALERSIHYERLALTMTDGTGIDDHLLVRGNANRPGERVPRRFLEALGGAGQPAPSSGSGRLELARAVANAQNPLTARVIVNRVWQHHFGEGLVRTPDDFGNMGQPPTHPELLDWLAGWFIEQGWSLKELHRLLLLTSTYQMSSQPGDPLAAERDPQNLLWHRMNVRRLEAESIRDAVLAVSGSLDQRLYGPGVAPHLTSFMIGRGRPGHSGPLDGQGRRSIFINVRRNFLTPLFLAFDYPVPFSTMGKRSVSNVPAQALALMNNPFVLEQAQRFGRRVMEGTADDLDRLRGMYRAAFGREPEPAEREAALRFIAARRAEADPDGELAAWADLAHVIFNVKEFVFLR